MRKEGRKGGREEGREEGRKGGWEEWREGWRDGKREGGREGKRQGDKSRSHCNRAFCQREGGREGERKGREGGPAGGRDHPPEKGLLCSEDLHRRRRILGQVRQTAGVRDQACTNLTHTQVGQGHANRSEQPGHAGNSHKQVVDTTQNEPFSRSVHQLKTSFKSWPVKWYRYY